MLIGADVHQTSPKGAYQRDRLAELRRRIADLEGSLPLDAQLAPAPVSAAAKQGPASLGDGQKIQDGARDRAPPRLCLDSPALDAVFQGEGLRLDSLHEVVGRESRDCGAVSGFALALLARVMRARSGAVLWVLSPQARRENGRLYGPGLRQFGIDPARLVAVFPRRMEELLWGLEEGAKCSGLSAVFGEVQGVSRALDLTATRRLLLRAQTSRVPVILMRNGVADEPTAALTRWCVTPHISRPPDLERRGPHEAVGRSGWRVTLTRNRDGRPGSACVEWNHETGQFDAPARSLALVSGSAGGQDLAPSERGHAAQGGGC